MNLNQEVLKVNILQVVILGLFIQAAYFTILAVSTLGPNGYRCITTGPQLNNCGIIDFVLSMALLQNLLFLYPTIISMAFAYFILALLKTARGK